MTDILRQLCEGNYPSPLRSHPASAELSELEQKAIDLLGSDDFDKLVYQLYASVQDEDIDCFREGFRLGASLMLELL